MGVRCPKCDTDNTGDSQFCKKCAAPLPSSKEIPVEHTETLQAPREELTTGSTFAGRYQIIEELGRGGMGKVYKALDTKIQEKVALKLIKPEIVSDKKILQRFGNELKIARKIVHKNVGRMYDINEDQGTHFITMEYVSGQDLKGLIRQSGQLGIGTAISIGLEMCEGLAEAHKLGVVHRDLKPSNIMIDSEGHVRIMDFGIARSLSEKGLTGAGVMIGTPDYMSPEQAEAKDLDQRSDIYSLGVILYEMVAGRPPFEGDTALSIAMKHKGESPKDPREHNSQITEELSRVILKCLEKDKEQRFQSGGEVRSVLSNIAQGITTAERKIPERKPLTSREITVQFSVKRVLIPALVFLTLIAAGFILWQVLPREKAVSIPPGKPSLAIPYFENNTGDDSLDHWRKGLSELLITDLMQSKYLNVPSGDRIFTVLKGLNLLDAESYSSENLLDIAQNTNANHVLRGGFTRADDVFRISVMLQNASTGETVATERVEGKGEGSLYAMVDELTKRIKVNFELSSAEITGDIDKDVDIIATKSPEAYRYYVEGKKQHLLGNNREATQFYEKAVALDPDFALAYRAMAMAYANMGYRVKAREFSQKALSLSDRLPDRERYLIQGDFYSIKEQTFDKAIEAYHKLLSLYPDDATGNNNLAVVYSRLDEWEKAIEGYEAAYRSRKDVLSIGNLGTHYETIGLYDKAREMFMDFIENVSNDPNVHEYLAYNALYQGKFDQAWADAAKASELDPTNRRNFWLRGDIYRFSGNFSRAEEEYSKILKTEQKPLHLTPRWRLAVMFVEQGKFKDAIAQLGEIEKLTEELGLKVGTAHAHRYRSYICYVTNQPQKALEHIDTALKGYEDMEVPGSQRSSLCFKGIYLLQLGEMTAAQDALTNLKELIDSSMAKKVMRYFYLLSGSLDLKKENCTKAVESFEKAISFLPHQSGFFEEHVFFMNFLASAYFNCGSLEKALAEYEKITLLTTGRSGWGDIYAKAFYMIGKIHEEQGNAAGAVENYEKFLDLWKDADPGIDEVKDAKKRLAGLRPSPSPSDN